MEQTRFNNGNERYEYQTDLNEIATGKREYKEQLKNVGRMKPYICLIHSLRFWRNVKLKSGQCSFCNTFNKRINRRTDIMAFEKEEGMNFVDWTKEKQEVVGKLINKITEFGENDSTVYVIEDENGKLLSIWETGFLANLMTNVKIGNRVKIVYTGLGEAKKRGFNPPKLFDVFVDR